MQASYLPGNADLFDWRSFAEIVQPWRPRALTHVQWPPDYLAVYAWRLKQLELLKNPAMVESAKAYYSEHPAEFIMHWMDTYNPRKTRDKWMPFVFFSKQLEFAHFLHSLRQAGESGLVEKCRDAGATWESCAYSVWSWLFIPNDAIGWGSRKEQLVDRLGDADSIFEKMRLLINRLPDCFKPEGFVPKFHATFCKLINPENGSTITGEAGDNIGRGGRNSMYFKDESAHYERPELVEAALGDNTNVQIDISSVNGPGNVFHRRREAGIEWTFGQDMEKGFTQVFVIDWRDHPEKTQEWYDNRRAKAEREGMLHLFAQEVDRNYSAAILNTIIDQEWVRAAIDAHLDMPAMMEGPWRAALDVAGEDKAGADRNALSLSKGVVLRSCIEWGSRDPGVSTRNVIDTVRPFPGIEIQYDVIGIGEAVKSEFNRLVDSKDIDINAVRFVPWNAGAPVQRPHDRVIPDDDESAFNRDIFLNLKAQAWWNLRTRFYKTWRWRKHNVIYRPDELISIDSNIPLIRKIEKELIQPTRGQSSNLKMIVDKKPDGMASPNLADSIVMNYFPVDSDIGRALKGNYGV